MSRLNQSTQAIRFLRGLAAKLTSANNSAGLEGEPYYATDSGQLYIHNGINYKHIGLSRTSSSSDPTTTELPNDGDACIHKNTSSGNIYLAFNNSGSIVKTQLT